MSRIKLSEIKEITKIVSDWREVCVNIDEGSEDFCVDGYRFIHYRSIDQIMCDELAQDEYILGCFQDWFLSAVLDLDIDIIHAIQEAEAYAALGKLVLSLGKLPDLQEKYVAADGYGHHFSHYDGSEEEITFEDYGTYHVFRVE